MKRKEALRKFDEVNPLVYNKVLYRQSKTYRLVVNDIGATKGKGTGHTEETTKSCSNLYKEKMSHEW